MYSIRNEESIKSSPIKYTWGAYNRVFMEHWFVSKKYSIVWTFNLCSLSANKKLSHLIQPIHVSYKPVIGPQLLCVHHLTTPLHFIGQFPLLLCFTQRKARQSVGKFFYIFTLSTFHIFVFNHTKFNSLRDHQILSLFHITEVFKLTQTGNF